MGRSPPRIENRGPSPYLATLRRRHLVVLAFLREQALDAAA
jgi:hypothetical protein